MITVGRLSQILQRELINGNASAEVIVDLLSFSYANKHSERFGRINEGRVFNREDVNFEGVKASKKIVVIEGTK